MCGIAGYLDISGTDRSIVKRMSEQLQHRGPDDAGTWVNAKRSVALAHTRLSIIDTTSSGHQPMASECGRYVISFNGEIYNFRALRKDLENSDTRKIWQGHSDTEVILAAFSRWGIDESLKRFVGMFAIAIWDKKTEQLFLARDRMGEKPLYYGWSGGVFLFASELKAIKAHPSFHANIDSDALTLFMRHSYVPAPHTIWKGINKLTPGCCLVLHVNSRTPVIKPYWSLCNVASRGIASPFDGTPEEAVDELECLLTKSISGQMISDVPLGAFLSGGVDSSVVASLMNVHSNHAIKTFSIGFNDKSYNEAKFAKEVASHLGTDHTELYVSSKEVLDVIPQLPFLYDEPFADSSQIPTFLLARMARQSVTVSLSGDGGDELFCGYNRYNWATKVAGLPAAIRVGVEKLISLLSPREWDKLFKFLTFLVPEKYRYNNPGDKLHKLAALLSAHTPEEIYFRLVSHWDNAHQLVLNGNEPLTAMAGGQVGLGTDSSEQRMMYLDQLHYLPDDILTKVDRAAMSASLETRIPMLDHRVVEFAWSLPLEYKLRAGQMKWPLRQLLYRHVPQELIDRPKMGFGIPIDAWLRGPLREWAEALINSNRLEKEGYLNSKLIQEKWNQHISGRRNWAYHLWDVLMFQAWLEANR